MEQLIIDIESNDDAQLIKELLKRFKKVEVKSFSSDNSDKEIKFRIQQGLNDAACGRVKDWNSVKQNISSRIKTHKK